MRYAKASEGTEPSCFAGSDQVLFVRGVDSKGYDPIYLTNYDSSSS